MKYSFLIFLFIQLGFSQAEYPKDYFRNPLDIPLILAGNFAELRSNHFHTGIDIKTGGVEAYDDETKTFVPVDKHYAEEIAKLASSSNCSH